MAPEEYAELPYPHPYLEIWLECKRHANMAGVPALPQPEKGILDQDADLMLAFDVLEELSDLRAHDEELREKNRKAAQQMGFGLPLE